MADNTVLNTGSGGDTIATADLNGGTLNGVGQATSIKVERAKAGWGTGSTHTDVSTGASALPVQGAAAAAAAVAGNPVLAGGSDGTNARALATDTSGRQIAVGPTAAGSAIGTTAPVLVGGSDSTNVQRMLVDTSGRPRVDVATWAGTAVTAAAAMADAVANPTVGIVGAGNELFNGTTWDRQRANFNITTGDSGAKSANFLGATQTNYNARGAIITLLVGAVSGTFTTWQTGLQWSPDGGTTWLMLTPAGANLTSPASGNTIVWHLYPGVGSVTPAAVGGGSVATQYNFANQVLPRTWRFAMSVAGTTPSLTITGVYVNYIV